jgi:hypothetical protein
LRARLIGQQHHERIQRRVVLFDLFEVGIDKFHGRQLASADSGGHFRQRQTMWHQPSLHQFMAGTMLEVATYGFEEARACVIGAVSGARRPLPVEEAGLLEASGRVLAEDIVADRDCPAVPRSVRDGFAVRAADAPGRFEVIGEVRAGEAFAGVIQHGQAVEIMTGAPMPAGADAVVMVEHVIREHTGREGSRISTDRTLSSGENFNPAGVEARAGDTVVPRGALVGCAEIAMAATVGRVRLHVFARPHVAILATGDELVDMADAPLPCETRTPGPWPRRCCPAVQCPISFRSRATPAERPANWWNRDWSTTCSSYPEACRRASTTW